MESLDLEKEGRDGESGFSAKPVLNPHTQPTSSDAQMPHARVLIFTLVKKLPKTMQKWGEEAHTQPASSDAQICLTAVLKLLWKKCKNYPSKCKEIG